MAIPVGTILLRVDYECALVESDISGGSPEVLGDDYILPKSWIEGIEIDDDILSRIPENEVLELEAWDQS